MREYKEWTADELALIHRLYGKIPREELAGRLNCTINQLSYKANRLMLQRSDLTRKRPWSDDDDKTLRRLFGKGKSPDKIGRYMGRASSSVYYRLRVLGLECRRDKDDIFSIDDTVSVLGISAKKIHHFIGSGALKAHSYYDDGRHWNITGKEIARFVRAYPGELQGHRVDLVTLVSLL